MTETQRKLLQHTLGNKSFFRNHFCTSEETSDFPPLCELVESGHMTKIRAAEWMGGGWIFHATDTGKKAAFKNQ